MWSAFPFLGDVDSKVWLIVLGGPKRVHNLVQSLSTAGKDKLVFPSSRKGVGHLLFETQGSLCVEGRDESRKRPENGRQMKNKCSYGGGRMHREKEKVAFDGEQG